MKQISIINFKTNENLKRVELLVTVDIPPEVPC